MRGRTKNQNTTKDQIAYQPPQDNIYWVYKRRNKEQFLETPYAWFLDWKEIKKIKLCQLKH